LIYQSENILKDITPAFLTRNDRPLLLTHKKENIVRE